MKAEILTLLREKDGYVSGQELCNRFGVSRTAVWKAINQLKESGYEIEAVPNKGYHLVGQQDILNKNEIESRMNTTWAGRELYYFDSTGSTNLDVKRLLEEGAKEGVLAVAGEQTQGRGRRGRSWQSPPDTNIYMTLGLRPDFQPDLAPMVTLIDAMAVAEAVEETCGLKTQIKWPNDVVIGGKKICGILTEMSAETGYIHYVVIGTGINVNITKFPDEIKETATSLCIEKGESVLRAPIVAKTMEHFERYYERFIQTKDLSLLMEDYNRRLVNKDARVKVLDPKGEFEGTARGIDKKGQLLVQRQDGSMEEVYAGEVSVRGVYGYV
ncbi:MAG: biotin--[acetyl-CoA-carboxylase] ligase [Lachnospiraceae bacterium]|nr:biotin--[acetyl-CoA-carboxylase] ligase [Lachnospiraceae bacterium]